LRWHWATLVVGATIAIAACARRDMLGNSKTREPTPLSPSVPLGAASSTPSTSFGTPVSATVTAKTDAMGRARCDPRAATEQARVAMQQGILDRALEQTLCAAASSNAPEVLERIAKLKASLDSGDQDWLTLLGEGERAAAKGDAIRSAQLLARARYALVNAGARLEPGLPHRPVERYDGRRAYTDFKLVGDIVYTATEQGLVASWDRRKGKLVARIRTKPDRPPDQHTLEISSDHRWGATLDRSGPMVDGIRPRIDVWSTKTGAGRTLSPADGHASDKAPPVQARLVAYGFCSSQNQLLAVTSQAAILWDVETAKPLRQVRPESIEETANASWKLGSVSPDCRHFVAHLGKDPAEAGVWNSADGKLVKRFVLGKLVPFGGIGNVPSFSFAPKGDRAAVGFQDHAFLWDAGQEGIRGSDFHGGVLDVLFTAAGTPVAVTKPLIGLAGSQPEIVHCSPVRGRPLACLELHGPSLRAALSLDGRELLVLKEGNNGIAVHDFATGAYRRTIGAVVAGVRGVAVAGTGPGLATVALSDGEGRVYVWSEGASKLRMLSPAVGEVPRSFWTHRGTIELTDYRVHLDATGTRLIATDESGTLVLDTSSGAVVSRSSKECDLIALGVGGTSVCVTSDWLLGIERFKGPSGLNAKELRDLRDLLNRDAEISAIALLANGSVVHSRGRPPMEPRRPRPPNTTGNAAVVASPPRSAQERWENRWENHWMATPHGLIERLYDGPLEYQLRFQEGKEGQVLGTLPVEGRISALAPSRDGTLIAAITPSKVLLIDAAARLVTRTLVHPGAKWVNWHLAFSPDGTRLAAAGMHDDDRTKNALLVWDLNDGSRLVELRDQRAAFPASWIEPSSAPTRSVAFLSRSILLLGNPVEVTAFDVERQKALAQIMPVAGGGLVAWTPDGEVDATGRGLDFITTVVREASGGEVEVSSALGWARFGRPDLIESFGRGLWR
jgi:WD40 repeat protein